LQVSRHKPPGTIGTTTGTDFEAHSVELNFVAHDAFAFHLADYFASIEETNGTSWNPWNILNPKEVGKVVDQNTE